MMHFEEIDKSEIYEKYNNCYHEKAIYYNIKKGEQLLCIYGVIPRTNEIAEAFWITNSFHDKVFCKRFFHSLFKHLFSLGYKEIYTWTRCKKLVEVFGHFKNFGIIKSEVPYWDNDSTKVWFVKRI